MRTIETAALLLEPQIAAHAPEMFAVLCDPAIYTYENAPPASLEWLRARFARLESRRSADGLEQWLNWVIRLRDGPLIGYVQATIHADGSAGVAYELSSRYWGRGLGALATRSMLSELAATYNVTELFAVAKAANVRSLRMLQRLGFAPLDGRDPRHDIEADEVLFLRSARAADFAAADTAQMQKR
ncbi:MAG: GNAT family N-acetyltransferase [Betaproteobacteria bacterium]